ncbi:MAG TPA: hypothetical protein VNT60_03975, partial [Deinococcales bacterium]|nr:hypothetical protein [Deinococcales bacterium]
LLAKRLQVNVDRTQRLLNDLLAFLRAGRGSAPMEDVDLGARISDVLGDLQPAIESRGRRAGRRAGR